MSEKSQSMANRVDSVVFVRALGIFILVAAHSTKWGLYGGLNLLLLASGISFATVAFKSTSFDTVRRMAVFLSRLVIWTLVITLISAVLYGGIGWEAFLFVSNLVDTDTVAAAPIWYTHMMVQLLLAIALMFLSFNLTPKFLSHPMRMTFLFLFASALIFSISKLFFDTVTVLEDQLPHLYAWNFILGWVYWAHFINKAPEFKDRVTFSIVFVTVSWLVFYQLPMINGPNRIFWFLLSGFFLVSLPYIWLGSFLCQVVRLLNQATLTIFLTHMVFIRLANQVLGLVGYYDAGLHELKFAFVSLDDLCRTFFGLILPVLLWIGMTAFLRTLRREKILGSGSEKLKRIELAA